MQTYSTEFSSGLFEFDSNWQRIFVTALTFRLDQAISGTKIAEFANSVDLDEVAHNEPPHLELHCLPSNLSILSLKISDKKFVIC